MQLIIVCRFIPGGRTAVTLSCGLIGYSRRRFVVATAIAAVIWALYAFFIGRLGGKAFEDRPWVGFLVAFGVTLAVSGLIEAARRIRAVVVRRRHTGQVEADHPGQDQRRSTPASAVDTPSPRKTMPTAAAPAAPIPVHTA